MIGFAWPIGLQAQKASDASIGVHAAVRVDTTTKEWTPARERATEGGIAIGAGLAFALTYAIPSGSCVSVASGVPAGCRPPMGGATRAVVALAGGAVGGALGAWLFRPH